MRSFPICEEEEEEKKRKKKLVQEVKKIVLTADSIVLSIDVFDFLKTNVM